MERPDAKAIIDFLAQRYDVEPQGETRPDPQDITRHLDAPEYREKLLRLQRMHRYVKAEKC